MVMYLMMRAKVYGVSLSPNTTPNHFDVINLKNNMDSFLELSKSKYLKGV